MNETLVRWLRLMVEKHASDLHVSAHGPPRMRIHGSLVPCEGEAVLSSEDSSRICLSAVKDTERKKLIETRELDSSFGIEGLSRFRSNFFYEQGNLGAVFRTIPFKIKSFDDLGLPKVVGEWCKKPRGLVLVTGPTGSGKSTTLAAMVDCINSTRDAHIITIEDPIEFIHASKKSLITQREVGTDTHGFTEALKHVLRQDPDVVLIGEMRNLETIAAAISIAETGHLVFATLHTSSCVQTISRIIDVFPAHQQDQVRAQLSLSLEAVLCQELVPNTQGGRTAVLEIMVNTFAIANLMRENKLHQIESLLQTGRQKYGMQTRNQHLLDLLQKKTITMEEALDASSDPDDLRRSLLTQK